MTNAVFAVVVAVQIVTNAPVVKDNSSGCPGCWRCRPGNVIPLDGPSFGPDFGQALPVCQPYKPATERIEMVEVAEVINLTVDASSITNIGWEQPTMQASQKRVLERRYRKWRLFEQWVPIAAETNAPGGKP